MALLVPGRVRQCQVTALHHYKAQNRPRTTAECQDVMCHHFLTEQPRQTPSQDLVNHAVVDSDMVNPEFPAKKVLRWKRLPWFLLNAGNWTVTNHGFIVIFSTQPVQWVTRCDAPWTQSEMADHTWKSQVLNSDTVIDCRLLLP